MGSKRYQRSELKYTAGPRRFSHLIFTQFPPAHHVSPYRVRTGDVHKPQHPYGKGPASAVPPCRSLREDTGDIRCLQRWPCSLIWWLLCDGTFSLNSHGFQPQAMWARLYRHHFTVREGPEISSLKFQRSFGLIFSSQRLPSLVSLLCITNTSYTAATSVLLRAAVCPIWKCRWLALWSFWVK